MFRSIQRLAAPFLLLGLLGACASVQTAIDEPQLRPIEDPTRITGRMPVSVPQPQVYVEQSAPNSLWRTGARGFFKDQRASTVGDILTVEIDITDAATLRNTTNSSRTGTQNAGLSDLFGFNDTIEQALPGANSLDPAIGFNSSSSAAGTGSVNRAEAIRLTVAALITDVLPNGNFVIAGRQEVKVNAEVRELLISGIIRPEDISATNTIAHKQIAEARVSYGGRGDLTRVQRPRIGQRLAETFLPF